MTSPPFPEILHAGDRVVLFDGVCNLCNRWVQFLLKYDVAGALRLASIQSRSGQQILAWAHLPTEELDTMVFVENGIAYTKSEAFFRAVRHLPIPWCLTSIGVAVPRFFRDWVYDLIAQNRYMLFGRSTSCMMPTPQLTARFLP